MNNVELENELARLRAENDALKAKKNGVISLKVSSKGALSVYGLGRFPVTLYKSQWIRFMNEVVKTGALENALSLEGLLDKPVSSDKAESSHA